MVKLADTLDLGSNTFGCVGLIPTKGIDMFSIKVEGFKTEAQAKAFIEWYEGQGEQSAAIWFEERKREGEIDVDFMPVDCKKTYPIVFNNNEAKMVLKV